MNNPRQVIDILAGLIELCDSSSGRVVCLLDGKISLLIRADVKSQKNSDGSDIEVLGRFSKSQLEGGLTAKMWTSKGENIYMNLLELEEEGKKKCRKENP
jgi:hypothetical protein